MRASSYHTDVLELPRVFAIEIFSKQGLAAVEGRPVTTNTDDLAEIGSSDFKDSFEINLLGLDDSLPRMLEPPDDAGEHRRGDLQRRSVVVRRHLSRLGGRQARAEPVDSARRTHQEHPELVGTLSDFLHHKSLAALQPPVLAGEFVQA